MALSTVATYPSTQPWSITTANQLTLSSVAVQSGDLVLVYVGSEGSSSAQWGTGATVTMNSTTFTKVQNPSTSSTDAKSAVFYLQVSFTGTYTITIDRISTGSIWWGSIAGIIRGSNGVGTTANANDGGATASLAITTTQANSAVLCVITDWQAHDGASRVYKTVNSSTGTEWLYQRNSSRATAYANYWSDVGAAGAKTVGLASGIGSTMHGAIVAVEVLLGSTTKSASTTIGLGLAVSGHSVKAGSSTSSVGLGLASTPTSAKRGTAASSIGLGLATSGSSAKIAASSSSVPLGLATSGSEIKSGTSSASLGLGLATSGSEIKAGAVSSSVSLGLATTSGSAKTVSASATMALDITADVDDTKSGSAASTVNLGLLTGMAGVKHGAANTGLTLSFDVSATAVKIGVSNAQLLLDLDVDFYSGEVPEEFDVSTTLGLSVSTSANVHKVSYGTVPLDIRVDFDGDVAKTATVTVSLAVLLAVATQAIKVGQTETALAIMLALSGSASNPDSARDLVITLTTLQGYDIVLSGLESTWPQMSSPQGYSLQLSELRKE